MSIVAKAAGERPGNWQPTATYVHELKKLTVDGGDVVVNLALKGDTLKTANRLDVKAEATDGHLRQRH